jgi:hypothetical protein
MFYSTSRRVLAVACLLLLSGCGFLAPVLGPVYETSTSTVDQTKDEGYIQFTNTTSDHQIFLDGKPVGTGTDYSSGRVLAVPPGPHLVEITQGGAIVLHQKVFIGAGSTRAIELK